MDRELPNSISKSLFRWMVRRMLNIRLFEERASRFVSRSEPPGFLYNSIGMEGTYVGACMGFNDGGCMRGRHRSRGHSWHTSAVSVSLFWR